MFYFSILLILPLIQPKNSFYLRIFGIYLYKEETFREKATQKLYITSRRKTSLAHIKVFERGVGKTFYLKSFPHKNHPTTQNPPSFRTADYFIYLLNSFELYIKYMLFRKVYRTAFSYHVDLYLTRIFELVLDALYDIVCDYRHFIVADLFRFDHDSYLTACLDGK